MTQKITQARLKELLRYEPETGLFYWIKKSHPLANRTVINAIAGAINPSLGYRFISVDSEKTAAHRLAWLYVHGSHPEGEIDHINGDKTDNRLENLRCIPRGINHQNIRKPYKNNKTGLLGVGMYRKRFTASISVDSKRRHLGVFDTPEEAHQAYLTAKRSFHVACTI